jgi:hypothetical protein
MTKFKKFLTNKGLHPNEWEIIPDKYLAHNEIVFGRIIMSSEDEKIFVDLFNENFPGYQIEPSMNNNQALYAMYYMLEDKITREIKGEISEMVVFYSILVLIFVLLMLLIN